MPPVIRISGTAAEMYVVLSPDRALAICPPSSCPTGSRFKLVMSMPTHPANAIGCKLVDAAGTTFSISPKRIGTPSAAVGISAVPGVMGGSSNPTIVTTTAAVRPTSGPATPTSKSDFRSGIAPLSCISAPRVPTGEINGSGMKNGKLALIPRRFATK